MKKLSIAAAVLSLSIAAPVFACPEGRDAPATAEKTKASDQETAKAEKAKPAKPAEKAKAAKPADKTAKPADKISQR